MSKERKIAYEPHPVSPERKKELRSQGFRIVDERFAPAGSSAAPAPSLPPPPLAPEATPKPTLTLPKAK